MLRRTKSKYQNKKCEFGGKKFPSLKEMNRYKELLTMEHGGHIFDLQTQVRYLLVEDKAAKFKLTYVADFVYKNYKGDTIVEDCKGFRTPVYKQKAKIMLNKFGIVIKET
jgi:hypothetical protein